MTAVPVEVVINALADHQHTDDGCSCGWCAAIAPVDHRVHLAREVVGALDYEGLIQ